MFATAAASAVTRLVLLAALSSNALVAAFPSHAGVCTMKGADADIANEPGMQPASVIATDYTFTASPTTYNPGDTITITIAGAAYNGFLGFAQGTTTANYVGTWVMPTGYQNNNNQCMMDNIATESPDSTITHTAGQTYNGATLQFKAPATNVGDLSFNFIMVSTANGGYARKLAPNAVIVTAATPVAVAQVGATTVMTPCCGKPPMTYVVTSAPTTKATMTSATATTTKAAASGTPSVTVMTPCCGQPPMTYTVVPPATTSTKAGILTPTPSILTPTPSTTGSKAAPSSCATPPAVTMTIPKTVTMTQVTTIPTTLKANTVTVTNTATSTVPVTSNVLVTVSMTSSVIQMMKCTRRPMTTLTTMTPSTTMQKSAPSTTTCTTSTTMKTTTTTSCTTTSTMTTKSTTSTTTTMKTTTTTSCCGKTTTSTTTSCCGKSTTSTTTSCCGKTTAAMGMAGGAIYGDAPTNGIVLPDMFGA
ncbi:hypothetical protein DFJ73DRAFT_838912 [Zopfochytrium polystomum]|nr:hypothetical protein DFJ73DRAFT_838912 [Zopfochytrium polystomum]